MKSNIKLISLSVAALCLTTSLAHANVSVGAQNSMPNESNVFVLGGVVPSDSLSSSENINYVTYSPYQQMGQLAETQTNYYQPLNYATLSNYNQSFGVISLYGVNFVSWMDNEGKYSSSSEADDFGYLQLAYEPNGANGASFSIGNCEGSSGSSCPQSNFNETVMREPSIQVTEIKPDFQTVVNGSIYDNPPIYHIVIASGSFQQSLAQNSTVAPAYYLDFNNGTPFNGADQGGFAMEPVAIQGTSDGSNYGAYGLSSVDVYYHGNLPNVLLQQNFDDLYGLGPQAGSQPGAVMSSASGTLPTGGVTTGAIPPATLTVVINPGNTQPLPAVVANGMDQEAFQVQLSFQTKNGATYNISPTDPKYGWLYNDLYFVNGDGTLINNFYLNGGGDSISQTQGPYTANINSTSETARAGSASLNQAGASSGPQGGCSGSCPKTYYFSSTQVGSFGVSAMIDLRPTVGIDLISQQVTFPAEKVSFSPTVWNASSATLQYNQTLTAPSATNEAVYLNLDHTSLPVYVGFSAYESLSSNTYCANPSTNSYYLNANKDGTVQGSNLSFQFGCEYDNTNPDITTNAVDQYGDYNVTVGFGN